MNASIIPGRINFFSKKPLFLFAVAFVFTIAACQSTGDSATTELKRDTTITKANAYSDLFFDSLRLENYVAQSGWHDSLTKAIRNFYNSRNYQYSWFTQQGFTEQAFAFENMLEEYVTYSGDSAAFNRSIKQMFDSAVNNSQPFILDDSTRFGFEMNMSASFLRYARRAYQGNIALQEKDLNWFIPRKRLNVVAFLDSFTKAPNGFATEPVNQQYKKLKSFLLHYHELEKKGGFPIIPIEKKRIQTG